MSAMYSFIFGPVGFEFRGDGRLAVRRGVSKFEFSVSSFDKVKDVPREILR